MAEVGAFRERVMAVRDMSEGEGEEMLLDWTLSGRGGRMPQGRERGSEAKRHVVDMLYEMKVKVE